MQFRLLGHLAARSESGEVELGSPKQRSVLAVLLLNANEVVPTDRIIELVWGDRAPRTAEHSVQIYISELRKALSSGSTNLIDTTPPGYVINVPPDAVDTTRFERLVRAGLAQARGGQPDAARVKLEEALAVWTGEPLAEFAYEEFAQGHIRSLTELHSDALESLAGIELDSDDLDAARGVARKAIDADPLREEPRRIMMLALYRSARQADALRQFGEYRELLAEEMGIEPSESLRQLEEQVLLQDPTLDARPEVASAGNPYRGLRAFTEDDGDVYFGREDLVAEVLDRLENGPGFVSIVGPSGSGKSSAARAGVIPELRARGLEVAVFQPGSRPLWELAGAFDHVGLGSRTSLLRRFENDPRSLTELVTRPLVLIIDQFEELFTLAEKDAAVRFAELIAGAVRDHRTPLRVVATLRADHYDRPLSMPALAAVFSDSVVSVKPMTPREIERAVVEPARSVGMEVEPSLLAQLVADMGDEPGALPLLQFTLFQLYEGAEDGLTLAGYHQLGGINGALTGGADELLALLDPEGRRLAEQLMMRMVQKGRTLSTSRPVPLRDLIDLGLDPVILRDVLEAFGSRRLVTFDRDGSGAAVVEMAHEYLITEWPQMERWIERHADDLERLYVLESVADDWVTADRSDDYLLRGERLERFQSWRSSTSLLLTKTETEFIDSSVALRDRQEHAERQRLEHEAALQKRARRRLWAFGGAVAALVAAVTLLMVTLIPDPPPDIVASYCCRGDGGFGDRIAAGIDEGVIGTDLTVVELGPLSDERETLPEYVADGAGFVLMTQFLNEDLITRLIEINPAIVIGIVECSEVPGDLPSNVWCVGTANNEMGFLAGAAAGLTTETDAVGVILGVDAPHMPSFQAGFEQGVQSTNPNAFVDAVYLSGIWPYGDSSGFISPSLGRVAAMQMYENGADVIFAAAGYSNKGIHEAALDFTERTGIRVWTIGADDDEWSFYDQEWWVDWTDEESAGYLEERSAQIRDHILTSIRKRMDIGVTLLIQAFARGDLTADVELNVANGAIGYTWSGGHLDDVETELERLMSDLANGETSLPYQPEEYAPLLSDWLPVGEGLNDS